MLCVEIENLVKRYPGFTLAIDHLEIPDSAVTGIVGPNGSGKTTLLDIILNLRLCDSGRVKIFGEGYGPNEVAIKQDIGFIIDGAGYPDSFSAENLNSILRYIYPSWNTQTFRKYLERYGIPETKRISELSRGMQTKLKLCTCFAHSPRLLILDEITSSLDPIVRNEVLLEIKEYAKTSKASVLLTTHITEDLSVAADSVFCLYDGTVVFNDRIESLNQRYRVYPMGCVPAFPGVVVANNEDCKTCLVKLNEGYADSKPPASIKDIMLHYIQDANFEEERGEL